MEILISEPLLELQSKIGCEAFCVFLQIAKNIRTEKYESFSQGMIRRETNISAGKISKAIKILEKYKFIKRIEMTEKGMKAGVKYEILTDLIEIN